MTTQATGTATMMPTNDSFSNKQRCHFLTFDSSTINQVRDVYVGAASMNAMLILPTIALNVLLIISLFQSSEIRKPSTKILFSLALSDVLVGLVIEPAMLTKKIAELQNDFATYCLTGVVTYVAGGALGSVSFLTLAAIALDRYFVVHKGTKYPTWVTNRRVAFLVLVIWAVPLILYTSQFYVSRTLYFKWAAIIMVTFVVLTSIFYIKCFLTLRKQKRLIRDLNEGIEKDVATSSYRYKKSMHTMCYVFIAFNLCYLPYLCNAAATAMLGDSAMTWGAESITCVIVFSNSLINPIILFMRIKKIRRAMTATFRNAVAPVTSTYSEGDQRTNRMKMTTISPVTKRTENGTLRD